jgi:hypothetical protein
VRKIIIASFGLCAVLPALLSAQEVATKLASGCYRRAAADSGKVILYDSAAVSRWDKESVAKIARHELCIGMTADMMRKAWGSSRFLRSDIPYTVGDTTDTYYYRGATVIAVNRIVRAIRAPSKPDMP